MVKCQDAVRALNGFEKQNHSDASEIAVLSMHHVGCHLPTVPTTYTYIILHHTTNIQYTSVYKYCILGLGVQESLQSLASIIL